MRFFSRVWRNSSRATPSLRHAKRAKPRNPTNPAGIHLTFAGTCSDNRDQLSFPKKVVLEEIVKIEFGKVEPNLFVTALLLG